MVVKQCLKKGICGKVYKKGDDGYELSYCKLCGAPLEEQEEQGNTTNPVEKETNQKTELVKESNFSDMLVDEYGYIHFLESEKEQFLEGAKLIVYTNSVINKVIKISSNKIILNRSMIEINADSTEEEILIYSENNDYFIQNLSEVNVILLDNEEIPHNKSMKLNDGQTILLNSNNWIEFKMN